MIEFVGSASFWNLVSMSHLRLILLVLCSIPVLIVAAFVGWIALHHYWLRERHLRQHLSAQNRYLDPRVGPTREHELCGTIIIDQAAFNHTRIRIWWTADDVLSKCPFQPLPNSEDLKDEYRWPSFDRWVTERYLDASSGTAQLLASAVEPRKSVTAEILKERFPKCTIVPVFSAGGIIEKYYPRKAERTETL